MKFSKEFEQYIEAEIEKKIRKHRAELHGYYHETEPIKSAVKPTPNIVQRAEGYNWHDKTGNGFNCPAKIEFGGVVWTSPIPKNIEELDFINKCVDNLCSNHGPTNHSSPVHSDV
jgi:hypothetical protein